MNETAKEARILRMMKRVLTDIAKETFTRPGFRHPLSDNTIMGIRDCLALIAAREKEIEPPGESEMKPRFADEPGRPQVVQFSKPNNGRTQNANPQNSETQNSEQKSDYDDD